MTWHHSKDNDNRKIIILLPGLWGDRADFEDHGFIDIAHKNGLTHDFLSVDANAAYLIRGNFPERFMADVITPVQSNGYQSIWLLGISFGGYFALSYYLDHPETIEGVILLSPYTGVNKERDPMYRILQFIDRDHSPAKSQQVPYTYWDRLADFEQHNTLDNIYLGYGRQDDIAPKYNGFKQLLPPENIHTVAGNHDWPTWSRLWDDLLEMDIVTKSLHSTARSPPSP